MGEADRSRGVRLLDVEFRQRQTFGHNVLVFSSKWLVYYNPRYDRYGVIHLPGGRGGGVCVTKKRACKKHGVSIRKKELDRMMTLAKLVSM